MKSWKLWKLRILKWPTRRAEIQDRPHDDPKKGKITKSEWNFSKIVERRIASEHSSGQNPNLDGKFNRKYSTFCVEYSARMRNRLIIIVSRRGVSQWKKPTVTADWRNVSVLWSDLSFALAFSSARESVRIKTECLAWTDLQVSRLSSGPQPARKPTFSCNPLSPLHNSMTFGTTFPGLFPRRVFWMFYVILRLPQLWRPAIARDTLLP